MSSDFFSCCGFCPFINRCFRHQKVQSINPFNQNFFAFQKRFVPGSRTPNLSRILDLALRIYIPDHNGRFTHHGLFAGDRFFRISPPKSTGFEYFSLKWLQHHLAEIGVAPRAEDVQTTLVELTARSIAQALSRYLPQVDELYVCGGGTHNNRLMAALRANVGMIPLDTTTALGIDPDWVEAVAFAWLAHQTLEGNTGNVPTVTGARHAVILGGIYKVR